MALLCRFFSVPRANGLSVDEVQFQYDLDTASDASSDILLPASYTEIQSCFLPSKDPVIPYQEVFLDFTDDVTNNDYASLQSTKACLDDPNPSENISWSAFYVAHDTRQINPCTVSVLLPLFRHAANSTAMMRHCLTVVDAVVKKLSPSQIRVVTADQSLYALMKQIQWQWPNSFGEDKFVVLLGELHIEMALL